MPKWADVQKMPEYQAETPERKKVVADKYFQKFVAPMSEYQAETPERQKEVYSKFIGTPAPTPQDTMGMEFVQSEGLAKPAPTPYEYRKPIPREETTALDLPIEAGRNIYGMGHFLGRTGVGLLEGMTSGKDGITVGESLRSQEGLPARLDEIADYLKLTPQTEAGQEVGQFLSEPFMAPADTEMTQSLLKRWTPEGVYERSNMGDWVAPLPAAIEKTVRLRNPNATDEEVAKAIEGGQGWYDVLLAFAPGGYTLGKSGAKGYRVSKADTIMKKSRAGMEVTSGEKKFMNKFLETYDSPLMKTVKDMMPRMDKDGVTMPLDAPVTRGGHTVTDIATVLAEGDRLQAQAMMRELLPDFNQHEVNHNVHMQKSKMLKETPAENVGQNTMAAILSDEAGFIDPTHLIEMIDFRSKGAGIEATELVSRRHADINTEMYDSNRFVNEEISKKLNIPEKEALTFVMENAAKDNRLLSALEKIGRTDLYDYIMNPSEAMKATIPKVREHYNRGHKFNKKHKGQDLGFIDDYITHLFITRKGQAASAANHFRTYDPFTKKRKYATYIDAIENGLQPKVLDMAQIIGTYDNHRINSAFNTKFVDAITGLKYLNPETGKMEPMIKRKSKAPEGWIEIKSTELEKYKYKDDPKIAGPLIGKLADKDLKVHKEGVKVHPEIARELKAIFDERINFEWKGLGSLESLGYAYENVAAVAKKMSLAGSFFHAGTLLEGAIASGVPKGKAIVSATPYQWWKAYKKDFDIYKTPKAAKDAIEHGVVLGHIQDAQVARIQNMLNTMEAQLYKMHPLAGKAGAKINSANKIWDSGLWDYMHNNFKLWGYEAGLQKQKAVFNKKNGREPNAAETTHMKRQVAEFVNDSFGGQNWDLNKVLRSPKSRQIMQALLLSPDWTVSTLKQATAVMSRDNVRRNRAWAFWGKAALYYHLMAESVNLATTKIHDGDAKWTWQNDPEMGATETGVKGVLFPKIFWGYDDDGRKIHISPGKQFRELSHWIEDPFGTVGNKMNPVFREAYKQAGGVNIGSGFPAKWHDKAGVNLPERLKSIGMNLVPFSLREYVQDSSPGTWMFMFPKSRGMTPYKTKRLFKDAIDQGDTEAVSKIYMSALENNINAEREFKSAMAGIKTQITYDDKAFAREIWKEIKTMPSDVAQDAVGVYMDRGVLTPNVIKQLSKIIREERLIEQQRKSLGIQRGE